MLGFKGPAQPSPAWGDALNAGYLYLEVRCLGCDSHQTVVLNIVRRPKATPIHDLERYMRCKDCSQVRGYLPFVDEIQRALTAFPAKGLTLFGRNDGKPMTSAGLSDFMNGSDSDGLPAKCAAHGLRKAGMRRKAEAGKSEKQIAAMSGHKSLREVQRYTEAADQRRLARDAMGNRK